MRIAIVFVLAALVAHPATSFAGAPEVYKRLKSLAGEWDADLPGFGKLTSSVRVVSNGAAIEETIGTPTDNELSVYTLNADTILLTHFCAMTPMGHQVRLETGVIDGARQSLEFDFVGSTNLSSPAAPHMRRVVTTLIDRDHFSERWTKTEKGKDTVFDLRFSRSPRGTAAGPGVSPPTG
jgi:hypothetical protein